MTPRRLFATVDAVARHERRRLAGTASAVRAGMAAGKEFTKWVNALEKG